jgi:predicted nucleotidyltransferase
MARVRKTQPTLENFFFATPEQRVLRFLLSEPTTTFTPRAISSKLKGVRGLGGIEGIQKILDELEALGLVDFVDNRRAVRIHDENSSLKVMKTFASMCDLEGLCKQLEPLAPKGFLFGSRASGKCHSDSDYDLLVVTDRPDEALRIAGGHPLGKMIQLRAVTADGFESLETEDSSLHQKISRGIQLWGATW